MKEITQDERTLLDSINGTIKALESVRSALLDSKMECVAEFQIGERVYNCKTGTTDIVREHYRMNNFTSFSAHCQIQENGTGSYDNTSRYGIAHPWVKESDKISNSPVYIEKLQTIVRYMK